MKELYPHITPELTEDEMTREIQVEVSLWWRYLISIFTLLLGFMFIFCVEGRSAHFNKKNNLFTIEYTNYLTCKERNIVHDFEQI